MFSKVLIYFIFFIFIKVEIITFINVECSFFLADLSFLLLCVILCNRSRVDCKANRVVIKLCFAVGYYISKAFISPCRTPRVLNNPWATITTLVFFPTKNFNKMIAIVFECFGCPLIDSTWVRQEICVWR